MSTLQKTLLTPDQYLEIERKAEVRSEYYLGEMFAMAGASAVHSRLQFQLAVCIGRQSDPGKCKGFTSDMRVRTTGMGMYTYPDLSIVCGDPIFADDQQDTLLNPTLIAEVLSPSTEACDRGRRFEHYRTLDSLVHYLLIEQDRKHVDLFTRDGNHWVLTSTSRPDQTLPLPAVGVELLLAELYAGIEISQHHPFPE
jgi:Uma2 family endonuclease